MMTDVLRMGLCVVALSWLGCSLGPKLTVTETEMMKVSAEKMAPVEEGKGAVRAAEAEVVVATKAENAAARRVKIADLRVDRAALDVEIAKLRFEAAQETRDADAMLPAEASRKKAAQSLKVAEAELPFRKAEQRHRKALREEAEAGLAEARAALELAKLEAVLSTGPELGLEGEKRRSDFNAQLVSAKSQRAKAKQTVSGAALELDAAQRGYEALAPTAEAATEAEVVTPAVP